VLTRWRGPRTEEDAGGADVEYPFHGSRSPVPPADRHPWRMRPAGWAVVSELRKVSRLQGRRLVGGSSPRWIREMWQSSTPRAVLMLASLKAGGSPSAHPSQIAGAQSRSFTRCAPRPLKTPRAHHTSSPDWGSPAPGASMRRHVTHLDNVVIDWLPPLRAIVIRRARGGKEMSELFVAGCVKIWAQINCAFYLW
jgi:hypothetical protein